MWKYRRRVRSASQRPGKKTSNNSKDNKSSWIKRVSFVRRRARPALERSPTFSPSGGLSASGQWGDLRLGVASSGSEHVFAALCWETEQRTMWSTQTRCVWVGQRTRVRFVNRPFWGCIQTEMGWRTGSNCQIGRDWQNDKMKQVTNTDFFSPKVKNIKTSMIKINSMLSQPILALTQSCKSKVNLKYYQNYKYYEYSTVIPKHHYRAKLKFNIFKLNSHWEDGPHPL